MNLPSQPPPGPDHIEGAPSEGWRGPTKKGFWWNVVFTVMLIIIAIGCGLPLILVQGKGAERTMVISNAKQVSLALIEFDQDYGQFSDHSTAAAVRAATRSLLSFKGSSSNAMLRQLIPDYASSENLFFTRHPDLPKRGPDEVITPGQALKPGEVGFGYLAGLDTSMNPGTPLLVGNLKIGTHEFWDSPMGGKAVILNLDSSADGPLIRSSDSKVVVGGGLTLFDPTAPHLPAGYTIDLRQPEK